ncbi:Wadjet anti-phage system protein JetD domain-containing protein [Tessaracoccus sp. G1721]
MRTVDDLAAWAARQWRANWPGWLADPDQPAPSWPLHPPASREIAADPDGVAREVGRWVAAEAEAGVEVQWVERRSGAFGTQRLPARVTVEPAAMALLAGEGHTWARAVQAAGMLRRAWPDLDLGAPVRSAATRLGKLGEEDVTRLLAVLGWLEAHPDSGLWERELPVTGVDSKWLERHRGLVDALHAGIVGGAAGLRRHGPVFHVRYLDPTLAEGPREFAVGISAVAALPVAAGRVLLVENLTSLLALPELRGTVAVHGMGFAAPSLAQVPWIRGAEEVWYWGDVDTYGLLILGQVRAALPTVRSILMDPATLQEHRQWAGPEPSPFRGEIGFLTADEHRTLSALREGDLRLEQERIPRAHAHAALRASALRASGVGKMGA